MLPGFFNLASPRKVTELMLTLQKVMGLQVDSYGNWDATTKTTDEILV